MKAYKGFNKDMTCRGFQFEEGKTYHEDKAKLCDSGFHACEDPLDCFGYYAPGQAVYHEVELDEVSAEQKEDDSKVVAKTIKVGAEIGLPGIIKAHFEYVKSHITNEQNAEPGKPATAGSFGAATAGDGGAATAGYFGAATAGYFGAATAGYRGAATAGYRGAATAGYRGAATAGDGGAATAGYRGAATAGSFGAATAGDGGAATAGYFGAATAGDGGAATAGYRGAATAGDGGAATAGDGGAATAGYRGAATSRGSSESGKQGLSVARGNGCKVKGGLGAVLVAVEEANDSNDLKSWAAAVVDGEKIKADTWYTVKDGEFVEVAES